MSTHALAQYYLGRNFIWPELLREHKKPEYARNFQYPRAALESLYDTLPSQQQLDYCSENDMMLVPGPVVDTNLIGIRAFDHDQFELLNPSEWLMQEKITRVETVKGLHWLTLRKEIVPDSCSLCEKDQVKLVKPAERLPSAAEVSYCLTTYFQVMRVRLFPNLYVRTSSVVMVKEKVLVGYYRNGLYIGHKGGLRGGSFVGITTALRL